MLRRTVARARSLLQYDVQPMAVPAKNAFRAEGFDSIELKAVNRRLQSGKSTALPALSTSANALAIRAARTVGASQQQGLAGDSEWVEEEGKALQTRRWLRDGYESCVEHVLRSQEFVSDYVVRYKFDDPQWQSLLALPCGKPTALEVRSRHIAVALRHLVQSGHAVYMIDQSAHSVFHPKGLAERAYVSCTVGKRKNSLICYIVHEGPIDASKPDGERGVLAMSQTHSRGLAHKRRAMWKRSRRVGEMQAQMGCFDWTLMHRLDVGCQEQGEVFLIEDGYENISGGGLANAYVGSHQVAAHPYHYMTHFEAPVQCGLDALMQLQHRTGRESQLLLPEEELFALAWTCNSCPPFPPLEANLPFQVQTARPEVFADAHTNPDSTFLGGPWVSGAPLQRRHWDIHLGNTGYEYDTGPVSRGNVWWRGKMMVAFEGTMWTVRSSQVDKLQSTQHVANPFDVKQKEAPEFSERVTGRQRKASSRLRKLQEKRARNKSPSETIIPPGAFASATPEAATDSNEGAASSSASSQRRSTLNRAAPVPPLFTGTPK